MNASDHRSSDVHDIVEDKNELHGKLHNAGPQLRHKRLEDDDCNPQTDRMCYFHNNDDLRGLNQSPTWP